MIALSHRMTRLTPIISGISMAVCGLVCTRLAHAQGVDEFGAYGRPKDAANYESPQSWAFELRFGTLLSSGGQ